MYAGNSFMVESNHSQESEGQSAKGMRKSGSERDTLIRQRKEYANQMDTGTSKQTNVNNKLNYGIRNSRLLIYFTSFFCGMCIMAVELSATRLLAPYFGTSSIVWTVVIGIIMVSLSLGNYLGGRAADKYNSYGRLYFIIWTASVWIALIPLTGKYIIAGVAVILMWALPSNLIIGGSVVSCLVIFSLPLVILGMVSPYLVKLAVSETENTGKITGKIYSISTIGSIIGTCIPTFVTIPYIGTSKSFLVFALVLNLLCVFYFIASGERRIKSIVISIITAVAMIAMLAAPLNKSYAFWKNVIAEEESLYNYLQVYQNGSEINLSTNVAFGVQSVYDPDNILTGSCFDYFLFAPFFMKDFDARDELDVLVLGMATGTFVKQCGYFYPQSRIDGVEIDGKIVELAGKYFGLKGSDADIFVNDGRTFLYSEDAGMYDVVLVDAYHDITIPFHMATVEFFSLVKEHLKPGGVIIINVNLRSEENTEINDHLAQTMKNVVNNVYEVQTKRQLNVIIYGTDNGGCVADFNRNLERYGSLGGSITGMADVADVADTTIVAVQSYQVSEADRDELYGLGRYIYGNMREVTEAKLIFTDEITPVEMMGQKLLDEVVRESVLEYKQMIDLSPEGIRSFLKEF